MILKCPYKIGSCLFTLIFVIEKRESFLNGVKSRGL